MEADYIEVFYDDSLRVQVYTLRGNLEILFQLSYLLNVEYLTVVDTICMIYLLWYLFVYKMPPAQRTPEDKLAKKFWKTLQLCC